MASAVIDANYLATQMLINSELWKVYDEKYKSSTLQADKDKWLAKRNDVEGKNEVIANSYLTTFGINITKNDAGYWLLPNGQDFLDVYGLRAEKSASGLSSTLTMQDYVDYMTVNSAVWKVADNSSIPDAAQLRDWLSQQNTDIATVLLKEQYGIYCRRGTDKDAPLADGSSVNGVWLMTDTNGNFTGEKLYEYVLGYDPNISEMVTDVTNTIEYLVEQMQANSKEWNRLEEAKSNYSIDSMEYQTMTTRQNELASINERIGYDTLPSLGVFPVKTDGVWEIEMPNGDKTGLYDAYAITGTGKWGVLAGYYGNEDSYHGAAWYRGQQEAVLRIMNDGPQDFDGQQAWYQFDRLYVMDRNNINPSSRHYIFICRPDLYLTDDQGEASGGAKTGVFQLSTKSGVADDPFFNYLKKCHPQIIASLTGSFDGGFQSMQTFNQAAVTGSGKGNAEYTTGQTLSIWNSNGNGKTSVQLPMHAFIPYLTGRVEASSIPDVTIDSNNLVQPYTHYSLPYTTTSIKSTTGGTVQITFKEDRYYSIHKLFYAWIYYENNVMRNIFSPKDKYILYNAMDYATSIYDFLVDDTGENILYWTKYTGAVPLTVPMSDMNFNRNSSYNGDCTIEFAYYVVEHMDLDVLIDFNLNSLGYTTCKTGTNFKDNILTLVPISSTKPMYDTSEGGFLGYAYMGRPCVVSTRSRATGKMELKLRWIA